MPPERVGFDFRKDPPVHVSFIGSPLEHNPIPLLPPDEGLDCSLAWRIPGASPCVNFWIIEPNGSPPRDLLPGLLVDGCESILHSSPFEYPSPVNRTSPHAPRP